MWDYSEKVKDHFFAPRNAGTVEGANGIGVPFSRSFPSSRIQPARRPSRRRPGISTRCRTRTNTRSVFPASMAMVRAIRSRIAVDWDRIACLDVDPKAIPLEVEMKAGLPSNQGRPSLYGPGKLEVTDPDATARQLDELF